MRRWATSAILLSLLTILLVAVPVLAYTYRGAYTISENGTASHTMLPVWTASNNDWMIDYGFITDSTALDTRIETLGGLVKPHMVTENMTLTAVPVPINSQTNLLFTTGNTLLSSFDIILGSGGYITVSDNDTLELGDNFTVEQSGWVDTTYAANMTSLYKEDAFRTYISGTENVTSAVTVPYGGGFPTVAAITGGNSTSDDTNHTVNLPSGISAGDLLIVLFCADGFPTITFPGGNWTQLFETNTSNQAKFTAEYRVADGNEGSTIVVTTSDSQMSAHTSYRITDYQGTPEAGTSAIAGSVSPNPPSLTPSWGAYNTLWLAVCGYNDGTTSVSNYPASYTNGRNDIAVHSDGCGVGSARRELNAVSEDPGVFTISASEDWVANTIAIAPADSEIEVTATGVSSDEHIVKTYGGSGIDTCIGGTAFAGSGIADNATDDDPVVSFYESIYAEEPTPPWTLGYDYGSGRTHIITRYKLIGGGAFTSRMPTDFLFQGSTDNASWDTLDTQTGQSWSLSETKTYNITNSVPYRYYRFYITNCSSGVTCRIYEIEFIDAGLSIYVDNTLEDITYTATSVPDNSNDWLFCQNDVLPYSDNHTIWVAGTRQLWFRPNNIISGTTLPDRQGGDHPGTITWGVNPAGVSVSLGGMVSSAQVVPGALDVEPTRDILPEVEVTDWFVEPDVSGTLLTNPFRPLVTILSDTTTLTELQAWRIYAIAFLLLVTVSTAGAVRGHHAITGFAAGAAMLGVVVLTIFPMWTLVFTVFFIIGGLIAERSPVL